MESCRVIEAMEDLGGQLQEGIFQEASLGIEVLGRQGKPGVVMGGPERPVRPWRSWEASKARAQ
jgi:hypothetical protein